MVKWNRIFVRSIRGLPNFLAIPIMNPLTWVHDNTINSMYVCILLFLQLIVQYVLCCA